MDDEIATFLAFTATEDTAQAKRFLDLSGGNVEYAVQLFLESGAQPSGSSPQDEQLAQRLQQEAYQDNDVREADATVHRHETLLDSFGPYNYQTDYQPNSEAAIFGSGRVGIFNQRYNDLADFDEESEDGSDDDVIEIGSDDDVMEVDSDGEPVSRDNRRTRSHRDRLSELSSTQRRLADLFKPPFDLISRVSLDQAKYKGKQEQKWVLVNIQDPSEFQCQVLNRDFWSNSRVKEAVKSDFVFVQYQNTSPHGEGYLNFYSVDALPHISILDPITGERVKTWTDGVVPNVEDWIADVELFLEKFSLHPGSQNPTVKHEVKFDPDAMTEEQQIEYALKQSIGNTPSGGEQASKDEPAPEPQDPFEAITPADHTEPTGPPATRIQVRFPNGKRLIHKFNPDSDTVLHLYQWLKYVLSQADADYGVGAGESFTLSCAGKPKLLESLDKTIREADLSNASVLVEKD